MSRRIYCELICQREKNLKINEKVRIGIKRPRFISHPSEIHRIIHRSSYEPLSQNVSDVTDGWQNFDFGEPPKKHRWKYRKCSAMKNMEIVQKPPRKVSKMCAEMNFAQFSPAEKRLCARTIPSYSNFSRISEVWEPEIVSNRENLAYSMYTRRIYGNNKRKIRQGRRIAFVHKNGVEARHLQTQYWKRKKNRSIVYLLGYENEFHSWNKRGDEYLEWCGSGWRCKNNY